MAVKEHRRPSRLTCHDTPVPSHEIAYAVVERRSWSKSSEPFEERRARPGRRISPGCAGRPWRSAFWPTAVSTVAMKSSRPMGRLLPIFGPSKRIEEVGPKGQRTPLTQLTERGSQKLARLRQHRQLLGENADRTIGSGSLIGPPSCLRTVADAADAIAGHRYAANQPMRTSMSHEPQPSWLGRPPSARP